MTEKQFDDLTKGEKAALLIHSGELMARRKLTEFDIVLFLMDDFFAELWFHENTDRVVEAMKLETEMVLMFYPGLVEIPHLSQLNTENI